MFYLNILPSRVGRASCCAAENWVQQPHGIPASCSIPSSRVQCISCSKDRPFSKTCKNIPFRKEKKIKIVQTELCGCGAVVAEPISKGDFIVKYVGEVIDDAMCEERLWELKEQGAENFYMCKIHKDFVIDATFKGNSLRFLNNPNCKLEKWQVRMGGSDWCFRSQVHFYRRASDL